MKRNGALALLSGSFLVLLAGRSATVEPSSMGDSGIQYFHEDHLLGTNVITDAQGALIHHYQYKAFGDRSYSSNEPGETRPSNQYTGQAFDEDTGLYFYKARYYDPQLGRFIQPDSMISDTSNPQALNRYSYVLNNPLRFVDPSGKYEEDFHFYVTYYAFRAKGWSDFTAARVATFAQYVDDNSRTSPTNIGRFISNYGDAMDVLRTFHFVGGDSKTAVQRANFASRRMLREAVMQESGSLDRLDREQAARLGIAVHAFEDTFSHEGFKPAWSRDNRRTGSLRPNIGHADAGKGGHAPDLPYKDLAKALDAAETLFWNIPTRSGSTPLDVETLRTDLEAAFTSHRSLDGRIRAMQEAIETRFGTTVRYSPVHEGSGGDRDFRKAADSYLKN